MAKSSKKSTKKKVLRVAFIGAGGIAGAHMRYLSEMEDVELVALADLNMDVMKKHAETYNIPEPHLFKDWKEMLASVKPDAVSVCTPNSLHAPATIDALNAGAHVIVEKPMAMNAKEAQDMIDAAKKAKRKLVIGFQYRYSPKTQFLRDQIARGKFGDIMYVRCQALRRRGIPNWGVFGRKDLQGGGPMIDIGVHCLEMAHYAIGSPKPVAAFGNTFTYLGNKPSKKIASNWAGWDYKNYTVEDLAVGQIRFDNGAILTIEASFAAHIKQDLWNFQVMGEKAGATWEPLEVFHDDMGHMLNTTPTWVGADGFGENFQKKMRNFVDHTLHGKETDAPAEHGLMVQKMLDGIYAAAEAGHEVEIK